jgi:hypothetical protein
MNEPIILHMDDETPAVPYQATLIPDHVDVRRPGVCEGSVSGEFAIGFAADPCGDRAVWAWQPQTANTPVKLCDEHAAGLDLDDLEEL